MLSEMIRDPGGDASRTSALFEALGLGAIDADEEGCFVMFYDEDTSLHFQIIPAADLLKLAVSVCKLNTSTVSQGLRVVLRANLNAPRASLVGTLSVVPSTKQVLFNTVVPVVVPECEGAVRSMAAREFGALLERVISEALSWRRRIAHELGAPATIGMAAAAEAEGSPYDSSGYAIGVGPHDVIRA